MELDQIAECREWAENEFGPDEGVSRYAFKLYIARAWAEAYKRGREEGYEEGYEHATEKHEGR